VERRKGKAGAASDLFSRVFKLRPEGPKFEAEGRERERGSWGGGSEPPPHQLEGLGEHCKLP